LLYSFTDLNSSSPKNKITVAFAGNPNSGKSTLFNLFTGLKQSTGNFPGVTVDKKTGTAHLYNEATKKLVELDCIDLPGIYSLQPNTEDEKVSADVLLNNNDIDIVLIVADATNLRRNLFLATQIIDIGKQCVLALNMIDLVEQGGMQININLLAEKLGVPVLPISARNSKGIEKIKKALLTTISAPVTKFISDKNGEMQAENILRYKLIDKLIENVITEKQILPSEKIAKRLDKILTHKFWGYFIFLFVLALIFQSVFILAEYPMVWIENLFLWAGNKFAEILPEGKLSDLFINGIWAGLSGVVVFVPQIAFLFLFIGILEDTGYMARVIFIMDKLMRKFGLNGKSVIPLISGMACAVPAIMSARTIGNKKERLITILVTPLMSCSARLPVFTLLISMIIPATSKVGFFNLQGLTLMALYLLGFGAALIAALFLKLLLKTTDKSFFILELPIYRAPQWKSIAINIIDKVKVFVVDAGKVILAVSVILWALSSFAPGSRFEELEKKYDQTQNDDSAATKLAAEKLEASYAGILGKIIEPTIAPLGFDWKIGIALVTSFAAREVFVGTMATIYSVGDEANTLSIREKMLNEKRANGAALYSVATCLSLMVFYVFAMQCMSTLAVVYRETKSWKWPLIQFVYMSILAYAASFITYTIFN
jgi:ferrous iron transport protein B